ncbi:MAG: hypothetical protein HQL24_09065 [Candidatus Omnitrophica bacterium]|nr:hypothetical protein [Candidatus Omnitrophota bacterium]
MLKQILRVRAVLVICLMLTLFCPASFAQRGGDRGERRENNKSDNRGDGRRHEQRYSQGDRYHYRDGRWYKRGWFGWEFAISALVIGAIIDSLPERHTVIVVEGNQYYHDDNYYYRQLPDGSYVVVQPPVIVQAPVQIQDISTINIPNSKGGYTSVTLRRSGNGFVGPQGEFYPTYPSVEQLRVMYGN